MILIHWGLILFLSFTPAVKAHEPAEERPAPRVAPQRASRGGQRTSLDWAALRRCESGGDYTNRRNPTYRGAYQFDRSTWASAGGTGDPADARPEEQDMRARRLYSQRGAQPWPACGSRL